MRLYLLLTALTLLVVTAAKTQPQGSNTAEYQRTVLLLGTNPTDSALGMVYNQILRYQNASLDREVMLRQKLHYADAATQQLYTTKDSLLACIGKIYERRENSPPAVAILEQRVAVLEQQIIDRVQRDEVYFRALSVRFAREVYRNRPNFGCLTCYLKIRAQRGDPQLANALRHYATRKEKRLLHWYQVRNELEETDASVEFVTYRNPSNNTVHYGALLLRRSFSAPRYVPLCTQNDLNLLLRKGRLDEELFQFTLYSPPTTDESATLYTLLWQPLIPLLKGVQRIYYAPAGDLHRLNLAAVQPHELAPPLQKQWELVRINSTRSLIGPYNQTADPRAELPTIALPCWDNDKVDPALTARFFGSIEVDYYDPGLAATQKNAALFGNIYYDMDSIAIQNQLFIPRNIVNPKKGRRNQPIGPTEEWQLLFGATEEIMAIKAKLSRHQYDVQVYEGHAASEEAFKRLGNSGGTSPRIIHIATHGFFLADSALQETDNPMHRSGLILAGANHAWKKRKPLKGMEDGILTAFEISLLNLQNTELVVLSACETGLGHIENNEGVFGLQRAFKKAGVKNLIVSLWSIPDNATQALMTRFYQNCLEKDMPIRAALFAAQQWMREQENYQNPYFWAGFVLLE